MESTHCMRCGTRNADDSPQCWYCHTMLVAGPGDYVAPEPEAIFNGEDRLGAKPQKEQTTVVFVVLRLHIVSDPPLTPDDDGEILGVALDHAKAMLATVDGLPEDERHKVVIAAIEAADVVDRR